MAAETAAEVEGASRGPAARRTSSARDAINVRIETRAVATYATHGQPSFGRLHQRYDCIRWRRRWLHNTPAYQHDEQEQQRRNCTGWIQDVQHHEDDVCVVEERAAFCDGQTGTWEIRAGINSWVDEVSWHGNNVVVNWRFTIDLYNSCSRICLWLIYVIWWHVYLCLIVKFSISGFLLEDFFFLKN